MRAEYQNPAEIRRESCKRLPPGTDRLTKQKGLVLTRDLGDISEMNHSKTKLSKDDWNITDT